MLVAVGVVLVVVLKLVRSASLVSFIIVRFVFVSGSCVRFVSIRWVLLILVAGNDERGM